MKVAAGVVQHQDPVLACALRGPRELLSGQEQWILVHLEIQSSYEEAFASRISLYNAGIYWTCQRRVLTLAVPADLRRGWAPDEDLFQVGAFEDRLKFPVCKLIDRLDSDWRDDSSLPVLVARAQIEALRTAGDPEGRHRAKRQLVVGLYDLDYNEGEVRDIFGLLDWMMHLRVDLDGELTREITEFEEARNLPHRTSVERFGRTSVLLLQLAEVCGPLPQDDEDRVYGLPPAALKKLAKALLRFQSLDGLASLRAARPSVRRGVLMRPDPTATEANPPLYIQPARRQL